MFNNIPTLVPSTERKLTSSSNIITVVSIGMMSYILCAHLILWIKLFMFWVGCSGACTPEDRAYVDSLENLLYISGILGLLGLWGFILGFFIPKSREYSLFIAVILGISLAIISWEFLKTTGSLLTFFI